jgi:hypothetical protein
MASRKINISIPATNETSAGFSPRAGYPVVKFSIASQKGFLEVSSLKLVGRFQVKSTSSALVTPADVDFDKIQVGAETVGDIQTCTRPTYAPFGGVKTVIDKVVILSKKSNKELGTEVNYAQYNSLLESRKGIKSDFRNSRPSRSLSMGQNALQGQRRLNISQSGTDVQALDQGTEFSIPIDVPLLQASNLLLDEQHFGGLLLSIHLSPESSFFSSYMNGIADSANYTGNQLIDTFRYNLNSLRLEGRIIPATDQAIKLYQQVFPINSQVNLLQDIHSSSSSGVLNPQVSEVKGIVNLFLQQNQTNSLAQSEYSFSMPPGLRKQTQAKNNVRYPLKYPVDSTPNYKDSTAVPIANMSYPSLQTNMSESRLLFERALMDGRLPAMTSADMVLTEESERSRLNAVTSAGNLDLESSNLYVDSVGLGSDYSFGLGLAQDFRGSDYGLMLESGVNTENANLLPVYSANPLLQQSFVRNVAYFDSVNLTRQM